VTVPLWLAFLSPLHRAEHSRRTLQDKEEQGRGAVAMPSSCSCIADREENVRGSEELKLPTQ
jgi:hypothetical protein